MNPSMREISASRDESFSVKNEKLLMMSGIRNRVLQSLVQSVAEKSDYRRDTMAQLQN